MMSRLASWFRKFPRGGLARARTTKRRERFRPMAEVLEDRLVPSDMTQIPFAAPSGPTTLGLSFDGEDFYSYGGFLGIGSQSIKVHAFNSGTPAQTDQNIQDMLFRVSEIYAPFDVEVTRVHGSNTYLNGSDRHSPTTVFVGSSYGDTSVGAGVTPPEFVDYPWSPADVTHRRNSDPYDLAFVDPAGNGGDPSNIAEAIAHEAGHTFGLAHVRTDGLTDPARLDNARATVPDVMSYNRTSDLEYFADQSLALTDWNASSGLTPQLHPEYGFHGPFGDIIAIRPTTQNSFQALSQVLGQRTDPGDSHFHVADVGAIDPQHASQFVHPSFGDFNSTDSVMAEQGTITRLGDYDVFRWTAPANEIVQVGLTGQNGLNPLLLVYDNTGGLRWQNGGDHPASSSDLLVFDNPNTLLYTQDSFGARGSLQVPNHPGTLNVRAGQVLYFVVGAQDSTTTGTYQLRVDHLPGWAQLVGTTLTVNVNPLVNKFALASPSVASAGNAIGVVATNSLSIDTTVQGRLLVTLNGVTAQFEPGQVTAINVNTLQANTTVDVTPGFHNLSFLPTQITVNAGGGSTLTVDDSVDTSNQPLTITDQAVQYRQTSPVTITYQGLQSLKVVGSTGTLTVQSTAATTPVTLLTRAGLHEVDVGESSSPITLYAGGGEKVIVGTAQTLNGISALTVHGNGNTSLTVNDQANPFSVRRILAPYTQYTVTGSSLTRAVSSLDIFAYNTTTIAYDHLASLTLNAGNKGPNTVNVQSTSVPTTIVAGAATRQITIGVNGSVKNVRSRVTINGSGLNEMLLLDDSQATAQDKVTVTPTQVGAAATDQFFGPGGSLTYNRLSALTLNLSHAANDTVQLTPSSATAFFINGDATEFQAGHGAMLKLDLTGVINALLTPTGRGAGKWTFDNRQPVTFTNLQE
jgi:hypothetical protein